MAKEIDIYEELADRLVHDTGKNYLDYLPSEEGHEEAGRLFCDVLKSFYETGKIQSTGIATVDSQAKLVILEVMKSYNNDWDNVMNVVCGNAAFEFKK